MTKKIKKTPAPKKKPQGDEPLTLEKHLTDDLKAGLLDDAGPYNPTRPRGPVKQSE